MKNVLFVFSFMMILPAMAHAVFSHEHRHLDAELKQVVDRAHLGSGNLEKGVPERAPWPFKLLSIGHAISSYQNYGGEPYFHHGLDIRGEAMQEVRASVGGKVVNIENYSFGELYWEVAILDDNGFLWQYHHVDESTIPAEVKDAFARKGRIEAGTMIGKIVRWPVRTFGEIYHHVHLNILDGQGHYVNPFDFLEELPDQRAPEIVAISILKNGRIQQGTSVTGSYQIALEVRDLILHEQFIVPPHRMVFSIDGQKEQTYWQFDSLPGGAGRTDFVHDMYVARETCGNYSCRKLVFNLGFHPEGARTFPVTRGQHTLDVQVWDYAGNHSSMRFQYQVQ